MSDWHFFSIWYTLRFRRWLILFRPLWCSSVLSPWAVSSCGGSCCVHTSWVLSCLLQTSHSCTQASLQSRGFFDHHYCRVHVLCSSHASHSFWYITSLQETLSHGTVLNFSACLENWWPRWIRQRFHHSVSHNKFEKYRQKYLRVFYDEK